MVLLVAGLASRLPGQAAAPIIDTIVVINHNIFDENELPALRGGSPAPQNS